MTAISTCCTAIKSTIIHHKDVSALRTMASLDEDILYIRDRLQPEGFVEPHLPDVCPEKAFISVRREIIDWVKSQSRSNLFLLYGAAGSGKSTICGAVAEYFQSLHQQGASICFRQGRREGEPGNVIKKITFQLAAFDLKIRSLIIQQLEENVPITDALLDTQFDELLLHPLSEARVEGPVVVILDALDAYSPPEDQCALLNLVRRQFTQLPKEFRFLITARRNSLAAKTLLALRGCVIRSI
ncbi:uncharacterized protein FOMMEDRAFT_150699 [Fomitiporia mediterranea MF3/22]|uniref:uncharacterized protein n=1 Tax=Fomitiporia mediterranea (strain MF3/22) TaxID=694068 RepID=UPI0004407628|nr:uncharacterized protein FOMMEDRAFT_150699 [Fomitiporia mediterranea MF3/22]EJD08039.1 hypothetical protein FOMMEDRAFT_150699 [Fomitiporia mediterranea MF3/22]